MDVLTRLFPRAAARRGWCAWCQERPRNRDVQISDDLSRICVVRPQDFCSEACVEQANSAAAW